MFKFLNMFLENDVKVLGKEVFSCLFESDITTLLIQSNAFKGRRITMRASDFLRQFERKQMLRQGHRRKHTLQENALERAFHPEFLHAGTPYDWEELELYREELDRLDREGPGAHRSEL